MNELESTPVLCLLPITHKAPLILWGCSETGHFANDGKQASGRAWIMLSTFNGRKCKTNIQGLTIVVFIGPGSSAFRVPSEENAISNPQSLRLKISQSSLSKVSPAFNTSWLVQSPARTMEGSNVTEPRVKKRHFRSSIFTIKVLSIIGSHFTDFNRLRQSIILT